MVHHGTALIETAITEDGIILQAVVMVTLVQVVMLQVVMIEATIMLMTGLKHQIKHVIAIFLLVAELMETHPCSHILGMLRRKAVKVGRLGTSRSTISPTVLGGRLRRRAISANASMIAVGSSRA